MSVSESRSLSTITKTLIPRGQPCCVRHHKNTHLVGTIEPAHASFLSAANRKLRCMCLLQLALTDVRFWHIADNAAHALVRFWTKADKVGFRPGTVCQLLTQSGQESDTWQKGCFITPAWPRAWAACRAARRPRGGVTPPTPRWLARGNSGRRNCRWQRRCIQESLRPPSRRWNRILDRNERSMRCHFQPSASTS